MREIKPEDYLQIEVLEILEQESEIGAGETPYNSNDEAYFPVLVKWRPLTYTPRLVLENNDYSIRVIHLEGYIKSDLVAGIYQKIESKSPKVSVVFKLTEAKIKTKKVA